MYTNLDRSARVSDYAKQYVRCLFQEIRYSTVFNLRINFRQTNPLPFHILIFVSSSQPIFAYFLRWEIAWNKSFRTETQRFRYFTIEILDMLIDYKIGLNRFQNNLEIEKIYLTLSSFPMRKSKRNSVQFAYFIEISEITISS